MLRIMKLGRIEACRYIRLAKVDLLFLRQSHRLHFSLHFERAIWSDDGTASQRALLRWKPSHQVVKRQWKAPNQANGYQMSVTVIMGEVPKGQTPLCLHRRKGAGQNEKPSR